MTIKHHTCISIVCNGCGDPFNGYEDEYTIHLDTVDEFEAWLKDADPESACVIEGDEHYCAPCACERQTTHALTEDIGSARYCRCGS